MPDQISTYRTVRLIIQPGRIRSDRSYWCIHAVRVTRGVPRTVVLVDGFVPLLREDCTTEEILEAIAAVADQSMLHG
jgi:hypothetical protein